MPYTIDWLGKPRILEGKAWNPLTMTEIRQSNAQLLDVLNAADAPIYVLVDVSELTEFPHIASDLAGVMRYLQHPMLGCEIVYGVRSQVFEIIMRVMARITPFRYRAMTTRQDALDYVAQQDPALAALIATLHEREAGSRS